VEREGRIPCCGSAELALKQARAEGVTEWLVLGGRWNSARTR